MEWDRQFSGDAYFPVQNTKEAYGGLVRIKELLLDEMNPTQY